MLWIYIDILGPYIDFKEFHSEFTLFVLRVKNTKGLIIYLKNEVIVRILKMV